MPFSTWVLANVRLLASSRRTDSQVDGGWSAEPGWESLPRTGSERRALVAFDVPDFEDDRRASRQDLLVSRPCVRG